MCVIKNVREKSDESNGITAVQLSATIIYNAKIVPEITVESWPDLYISCVRQKTVVRIRGIDNILTFDEGLCSRQHPWILHHSQFLHFFNERCAFETEYLGGLCFIAFGMLQYEVYVFFLHFLERLQPLRSTKGNLEIACR